MLVRYPRFLDARGSGSLVVTHLHIDFETRGTVDLKTAGIDVYSRHEDTDVWCMAYAFGEEEVQIVNPRNAQDTMYDAHNHVRDGGLVYAHNASFELGIWNNLMVPRYGWPPLKLEQTRCTMAMAYAMALPGSLDKAAAAVGLDARKDNAGYRLMMQMCRPRSEEDGWTGRECPKCKGNQTYWSDDGEQELKCQACAGTGEEYGKILTWWDEPDKIERLYEYCKQDVRTERELAKRLMPLSDDEQALWALDQTINGRGFAIDLDGVKAAKEVAAYEEKRLNAEIKRVTGNFVGTVNETARLVKWLVFRGIDDAESVAKAEVLELLSREGIPSDVREALLIRQEAGRSSVKKLNAMLKAASDDGRIRGTMQYHGAGTGRWGGRRVQPHNLPRPAIKPDEVEQVYEALR